MWGSATGGAPVSVRFQLSGWVGSSSHCLQESPAHVLMQLEGRRSLHNCACSAKHIASGSAAHMTATNKGC